LHGGHSRPYDAPAYGSNQTSGIAGKDQQCGCRCAHHHPRFYRHQRLVFLTAAIPGRFPDLSAVNGKNRRSAESNHSCTGPDHRPRMGGRYPPNHPSSRDLGQSQCFGRYSSIPAASTDAPTDPNFRGEGRVVLPMRRLVLGFYLDSSRALPMDATTTMPGRQEPVIPFLVFRGPGAFGRAGDPRNVFPGDPDFCSGAHSGLLSIPDLRGGAKHVLHSEIRHSGHRSTMGAGANSLRTVRAAAGPRSKDKTPMGGLTRAPAPHRQPRGSDPLAFDRTPGNGPDLTRFGDRR